MVHNSLFDLATFVFAILGRIYLNDKCVRELPVFRIDVLQSFLFNLILPAKAISVDGVSTGLVALQLVDTPMSQRGTGLHCS